MTHRTVGRLAVGLATAATLIAAAVIAVISPAAAQPVIFPAGVACPDYGLMLEPSEGHRVTREFRDENGELVRSLVAGTGGDLILTNLSTNESLTLRSSGAVMHTTFNDDDTQTVVLTGHWVLILFPTDLPAGPSTTLHVGRVVYTADPNGVFTIEEVRGRTTDLCARLAG
jgi:hypothetical protein